MEETAKQMLLTVLFRFRDPWVKHDSLTVGEGFPVQCETFPGLPRSGCFSHSENETIGLFAWPGVTKHNPPGIRVNISGRGQREGGPCSDADLVLAGARQRL